jgi:hypothetical protein
MTAMPITDWRLNEVPRRWRPEDRAWRVRAAYLRGPGRIKFEIEQQLPSSQCPASRRPRRVVDQAAGASCTVGT